MCQHTVQQFGRTSTTGSWRYLHLRSTHQTCLPQQQPPHLRTPRPPPSLPPAPTYLSLVQQTKTRRILLPLAFGNRKSQLFDSHCGQVSGPIVEEVSGCINPLLVGSLHDTAEDRGRGAYMHVLPRPHVTLDKSRPDRTVMFEFWFMKVNPDFVKLPISRRFRHSQVKYEMRTGEVYVLSPLQLSTRLADGP